MLTGIGQPHARQGSLTGLPTLSHPRAMSLSHVMQRVVILGRGGAGKSTFARKLGETTGLPVIELDRYFWKEGLVPTPRARWAEIQRGLGDQKRWIMDGDLGKYDDLAVRLQAADTVIVLDFGILLCLRRAISRSSAPLEFWWWLVSWRWIWRPKIKQAIAEYAAHANVRIFSGPEELERFSQAQHQFAVATTGNY